jgi:hypothetical protein
VGRNNMASNRNESWVNPEEARKTSLPENPTKKNVLLKGYLEKFFEALKGLSPANKINLIYKNLAGRYPEPGMPLDKKLNRALYEIEFGKKVKDTEVFLANNKKQFKWPWKKRSEMKKSIKKPEQILVFFITITNELIGPKLYPMYGNNMIIIKNSPYELDPRAVLRFGNYKCIVIKEIDRRPVSNLDLEEVRKRGDSTSSDEFLIKAAMRSITQPVQKKEMNKTVLIIIGVIIVGALIFFFTR